MQLLNTYLILIFHSLVLESKVTFLTELSLKIKRILFSKLESREPSAAIKIFSVLSNINFSLSKDLSID